jgi:hypothetical protein
MFRSYCLSSFLVALSTLAANTSWAVSIPSNQGASQDAFVNPDAPFPLSSLYSILPVGKTVGGAHDTESLVKFDLSTLPYTAAQVTSTTLNLWVSDVSPAGFGQNPDAANPVLVDAYQVTSTWNRASVQWSNKPSFSSLVGSTLVDGIGKWVTIDVTSQVQSWLTTPGGNFGLLLAGDAVVGGPGAYRIAAFSSGFGTESANAPYLAVVPEPSSILLAIGGMLPAALMTCWRNRRKV